jgi:hypothetical protein
MLASAQLNASVESCLPVRLTPGRCLASTGSSSAAALRARCRCHSGRAARQGEAVLTRAQCAHRRRLTQPRSTVDSACDRRTADFEPSGCTDVEQPAISQPLRLTVAAVYVEVVQAEANGRAPVRPQVSLRGGADAHRQVGSVGRGERCAVCQGRGDPGCLGAAFRNSNRQVVVSCQAWDSCHRRSWRCRCRSRPCRPVAGGDKPCSQDCPAGPSAHFVSRSIVDAPAQRLVITW